jgi:hypothetical protein
MSFETRSNFEPAQGPGSSCMKWGADGELSAIDLQSILHRLSAVDEQASTLMDCPIDRGV